MKKSILMWAILLTTTSFISAQDVHENDLAIVYYMPKTELLITLEYEIRAQSTGIFYQYAERYLGATNIIMENTTDYILKHTTLAVQTTADLERAYQITPQKGVETQLISLSNDGRLLGYNIGRQSVEEYRHITNQKYIESATETLMPLFEEQFLAGSIAKMAEGAAKQIYRIRETRINILSADVEHLPSDGIAMQLTLDELKKQEQALIELFVGKTTVTTHTHTISYTPNNSVDKQIIGRFSKHHGIVDKDDLSGEPIILTLQATKPTLISPIEQNNKAQQASQIYYNLPGRADLLIEFKNQEIVKGTYQIAQYGIAIPLAQNLFTQNQTPIIYLNPETGNILSIQK